ncbi:MAG: phytanoyl-CoA dioxygenase family protein [Betaproteobacteria bacterium]|nr:phytanoyl-CoA dioxygenase family protein [Betaproteobacteria bacterium]
MSRLSPQQIARWRYDGFLSPFPLLTAAQLAKCRDGLARFEQWLGAPVNSAEDLQYRTMPHLILPWVAKLARDARILDAVEDLYGPDLLIYTSTFFIKEPHSPTIAAWHQDSTYFGLEPKEVVTVWLALSDANETAGCMESLSFKGKPRQLSHVTRVVKNSVNRAAQVITEPLDEGEPVAMSLKAGEFSMHHGLCAHRSGPNTASHRRIGLGLHYIATSVRPVGGIKPAATLVRGADRYGHFELVEPAQAELQTQDIATHKRAVGLYRDLYLQEEARHAATMAHGLDPR